MDSWIGAGDLAPVRKGDAHFEHVPRLGRSVRWILHKPSAALQENRPTTRGCERVELDVTHSPHPVGMQAAPRDSRLHEAFPAHRLDRVPPDLRNAADHAHPSGESTARGRYRQTDEPARVRRSVLKPIACWNSAFRRARES